MWIHDRMDIDNPNGRSLNSETMAGNYFLDNDVRIDSAFIYTVKGNFGNTDRYTYKYSLGHVETKKIKS